MALTHRGRRVVALLTVAALVAGVFLGVAALANHAKPQGIAQSPEGSPSASVSPTPPPPPPVCPLTGVTLTKGSVPARPALAVKIENIPEARPQTGLASADIVYEEPVEGGITRFIAVYQCTSAARIEPIRSARLTDPDILVQFGSALFAYAGGVSKVVSRVKERGLIDINYEKVATAYHRDPSRPAPHNLYSSTKELYAAEAGMKDPPVPVFTYSAKAPAGATKATKVHIPFSGYSDVYWAWSKSKKAWMRSHGTVPHLLSDGNQVSAKNVLVMKVKIVMTDITDANGVNSPEVVSMGSGKAWVFRGGKVIAGTWSRKALTDVTTFLDASGNEIRLARGNTWVELVPAQIQITIL